MKFLEQDLEEIIYNATNEKLYDRGLYINGIKLRQTQLKSGRADIIAYSRYNRINTGFDDSYIHFDILELKKDKIGISAFLQGVRYADNLKVYLDDKKPNLKYNISITLIGKEIDESGSFCYLSNLLQYDELSKPINNLIGLRFYTYKFNLDGINFEQKIIDSDQDVVEYNFEEKKEINVDKLDYSLFDNSEFDDINLTVKQASELLNLKERAVQRRCERWGVQKINNKYFINRHLLKKWGVKTYAIAEVAEALSVTKRSIQRKLKKMQVPMDQGGYIITHEVFNELLNYNLD
jgi:hypothetical protein